MNVLDYLKSNKDLTKVLDMFDLGGGFTPILIDKNSKDINLDIQEIKSIDVSDEMNGDTTFCLIINNKYYLCFIDMHDDIVGSFPTVEEDNAFMMILNEIKEKLIKKVNFSKIKIDLKKIILSYKGDNNKNIFYHGSPHSFNKFEPQKYINPNSIDRSGLMFFTDNPLIAAGYSYLQGRTKSDFDDITYNKSLITSAYIYKVDLSNIDFSIFTQQEARDYMFKESGRRVMGGQKELTKLLNWFNENNKSLILLDTGDAAGNAPRTSLENLIRSSRAASVINWCSSSDKRYYDDLVSYKPQQTTLAMVCTLDILKINILEKENITPKDI
jgi:hypothetical protein